MSNMKHMDYLEAVSREDIACLRLKEATYKGSWKSQGGKNAWAMIRRKIDRLMIMLGEPTPPASFNMASINNAIRYIAEGTSFSGSPEATAQMLYYMRDMLVAGDIFTKIEEDPSGNDGTVLAEVRDLRRYLLLVEAEIVSRKDVHQPDADESRHASEFPWRISNEKYISISDRISNEVAERFWTKRGDKYVLEPYAIGSVLPRELRTLYIRGRNDDAWVVNIDMVPETVRYIFPSLHVERNMFEHGELPEWQRRLYQQHEEKMVLVNIAWHVDKD